MKTYKIGNKVKCIIRSCTPGFLGEEWMEYPNQPYTILNDVNASFYFDQQEKKGATTFTKIAFSADTLKEITISNVELTNKILNLICSKNEIKKCHYVENFESNDKKIIYLNLQSSQIFDIFIYNVNGELEKYIDSYDKEELIVDNANQNYLICYSYLSEDINSLSYKFEKGQNIYFSLDFILIGNEDDETKKSYIHINKCALSIDKDMYFNNHANAVDLKFIVIDDHQSYITLE